MAIFNREDFKQLAEIKNDICISIFVPTARYGMDVLNGKHTIEFKNQIKDIRHKLEETSFKPREIEQILKPAEDLLNDKNFWNYQSDGLAMFLTNEFARHYSVPVKFDSFNYLGDTFYLKPMVPMLEDSGRFYILALSINKLRMFEAMRYSISEIPLEEYDIPTNMNDALRIDEVDGDVQFHTGAREGEGAMYFGHGDAGDDRPEYQKRYFARVDNELRANILKGEKAPIVLAGVEWLIPLYKESANYKNIVDGFVGGNMEEADILKLHEKAWEKVKHLFDKDTEAGSERVQELIGTGRAETELKEVVKKAYYGLVDELFVANMENKWGHYDENEDKVTVHQEQTNGDECLLNFAAVQTILKGGKVHLVDKDQMPVVDSDIAAVYRTEAANT